VPFNGSFEGTQTLTPLQPPFAIVNGSATGTGTHLGLFTVEFPHRVNVATRAGNGTYTFTAANGDTLNADFTGQAQGGPIVSIVEHATVTGGTGRFAGATGSFVVQRRFHQESGTTEGSFDGKISAPGATNRPSTLAEVREALAPTGKLRVALQLANPLNVVQDASGDMRGVGFDLGKELARRLGVPFEPVFYPSVGVLLDSGKTGAWDVAFVGFSAARALEWDFTGLHVQVEFGYLVPPGSPISTIDEVDRPGVRVAVQQNSGPDAFFTRTLGNAVVVRAPSNPAALELVKSGGADVMGSIKPVLFELSSQLPGSRVLEGRPGIDPHAMAIPKGRGELALTYARQFIESAKAEGLVQAAIDRAEVRGVVVAPLQ
jgi:polar amino acid transport system substrate-binding protein